MCGYYNSPPTNKTQRQVLWLRNSGKTSTRRISGPITDHTTGTIDGWYVFVPLDSQFDGMATLKSETFNFGETPRACVTFWYHIYSRFVKQPLPKLQVLIEEGNDHMTQYSVATINASTTDGWQQYKATITAPITNPIFRL